MSTTITTTITKQPQPQPQHQQSVSENINISTSHNDKRRARRLAQFYSGKDIFITGATGFIGKVTLIKLLGSLPMCGKIYVLLRSKKGLNPQQRFNKLITEDPFKSARCYKGNGQEITSAEFDWSKVIAVEGDMSAENLGLSEEDRKLICENVEILFNIAASVQFDAPLKQNLKDNYFGTKNMLNLACQFKRLQSLVHVSTFFSNCHLSHIEEKVLPLERDCEKVAELIDWIPDDLCDSIGPKIMENRPNTYIFTKAMSENLMQKFEGKLPIAILRPSIVTPSIREPAPGWVDNVNGPMGLGALSSLGILRNIDWNYWGIADVIPVDLVVNSMLTVAERTPRLYPKEIKVYNVSSSELIRISWGEIFEKLRVEGFKAPPYKMLRIPIEVPKHKRASKMSITISKFSELFFAYFIDFILLICGQKQILVKLTAKLHNAYELLLPFTTKEHTCDNDNLLEALEDLEPGDRDEFSFDMNVDQDKYMRDCYYGARRRLLREDESNIPSAIFKMRIMMVVEFVFKAVFWFFIGWTMYHLYENYTVKSLD